MGGCLGCPALGMGIAIRCPPRIDRESEAAGENDVTALTGEFELECDEGVCRCLGEITEGWVAMAPGPGSLFGAMLELDLRPC